MVFAYLFYKSIFGMVLLIPFYPIWFYKQRRKLIKDRQSKLCYEFKECLQSVSGALTAGYSMENAWKEAEKEMKKLLGEKALMTQELVRMNSQVALNIPVEKLLADFAVRSGLEDVQSFCQVFLFAKRGGGDFIKIIRTTSARIADKVEIQREIETVMAAKKLEQKIMSVMPLLILLYIGLTSPEFLNGLYGNLLGIIIMSGCLAVYMLSVYLAERIVSIEV